MHFEVRCALGNPSRVVVIAQPTRGRSTPGYSRRTTPWFNERLCNYLKRSRVAVANGGETCGARGRSPPGGTPGRRRETRVVPRGGEVWDVAKVEDRSCRTGASALLGMKKPGRLGNRALRDRTTDRRDYFFPAFALAAAALSACTFLRASIRAAAWAAGLLGFFGSVIMGKLSLRNGVTGSHSLL